VLEVRVIGSNFWAYYTHLGVTTLDFLASDASLTTGFPGIALGGSSDSISSWSGGGFPTMHGKDSIYNNPAYHTTYNTITNCQLGGATGTASPAACGSAAAGTIAIPASQTSYTVNTTAVTANSEIDVRQITDNSGIATATCNAGVTTPIQSARVAGTSFTITLTSVASVTCFEWKITN
jgi:hypothetical protein